MIRTQARAGPEIAPLERFVTHVARKVYQFMTTVVITFFPLSSLRNGTNATKSSGNGSGLQ
jgi:hypothetical protein